METDTIIEAHGSSEVTDILKKCRRLLGYWARGKQVLGHAGPAGPVGSLIAGVAGAGPGKPVGHRIT